MSSRIFTAAAIKGGTGKTATIGALAQAARAEGMRALAVDMDPQANLSIWMKADFSRPGSYDLLTYSERVGGKPGAAREVETASAIQKTPSGIDLICGAANLFSVSKTTPGSARRMETALQQVKNKYDLIVIDTAPNMGELQNNAIMAASGVLIPLEADGSSYQALFKILEIINLLKASKKALRVSGVLITRFDKRAKLNRFMADTIKKKAEELRLPYLGEIRAGVAMRSAITLKKDLFSYAATSKPAEDYRELLKKLLEAK